MVCLAHSPIHFPSSFAALPVRSALSFMPCPISLIVLLVPWPISLPSSLNAWPACWAPFLASRPMVLPVRLNTLSLLSGCSWSAQYAPVANREHAATIAMQSRFISQPPKHKRSAIQQEVYTPGEQRDGTNGIHVPM